MVTSEATNANDALELAVGQEVAEQLDQNTREFIAGLESQFNAKFAEEEVTEVIAAKSEEGEDEEGDEEDGEEDGEESDDEEGEDEYHDEGPLSGKDYE